METGVALVDLLIPIGKGQRELIIGDRKTGKTQFFIRTILNQSKKGNVCIYASVGKKIPEIKEIVESLNEKGIMQNTIVVASNASDSPGLIFITPYTAMAIAEYFASLGKDVIVILDDLTNHAMYYREISLLAGRFPGRNSYPGDIFYIHSKLLERGGNFKKGSITCFPVAETILGDFSAYIQTNLMSITDGHIFFDSELSNLGRRPAINPFLSVTRVGQQANSPLVRQLSRELSSFLINLEEIQSFLHFGAEVSEDIIQKLKLGDRILEFFNQPVDSIPLNISVLVISMLWIGSWRDQKPSDMRMKIKKMVEDYTSKADIKKKIDDLIVSSDDFNSLLNKLREGNYGQENYY
jgi:F-type H+-transporting ATPase subunit alpha